MSDEPVSMAEATPPTRTYVWAVRISLKGESTTIPRYVIAFRPNPPFQYISLIYPAGSLPTDLRTKFNDTQLAQVLTTLHTSTDPLLAAVNVQIQGLITP